LEFCVIRRLISKCEPNSGLQIWNTWMGWHGWYHEFTFISDTC